MDFLRALGRELLLDGESVDDATQSTLVVGLEQGPRDPRRARGWLARIFKNSAYQRKRTDSRRRRRELAVVLPDAVESTAGTVARHEIIRRIADAVSALDEPYRETLLLRFYDGLPPRKIAEQVGAPVATVKSRLVRAKSRLRALLDEREHDDVSSWRMALAPITSIGSAGIGHMSMGAATMKMKAAGVIGVAAVLALGGGVVLLDPFSEASSPEERESALRVEDAGGAGSPDEGPALEPTKHMDAALHDPVTGVSERVPGDATTVEGTAESEAPRSPPGAGVASNNASASRIDTEVQRFDLSGESAKKGFEMLSTLTGVEIVVSDEATEAAKRELTIMFTRTPLKEVLDTLTAFTGCSWSERSGVVYITK